MPFKKSHTHGRHEGEVAVYKMLKLPISGDPTSSGLPMNHAVRAMESPLVALGTLDNKGQPWTTVWGGEIGCTRPVAEDVLRFDSKVDTLHDPVFKALFGSDQTKAGHAVPPNGEKRKMMAALTIDLEGQDRVKLMGNMLAGIEGKDGRVRLAMDIEESLGNCPKYLNRKEIVPNDAHPVLMPQGLPLPQEAVDLIGKADTLFLSSTNGKSMDTNNRGGPPGFVRIIQNDEEGVVLIYPECEFSGNRLYQSLGNLKVNPMIGIVIPDFITSDVLYLTGSATILVGKDASDLLIRTQLAVKINVADVIFVRSGLPFRGIPIEYSPYNPPQRYLVTEQNESAAKASHSNIDISANFLSRETITPTISRFTFKLSSQKPIPSWHAGQYIALDFAPQLYQGWSHMRDHDPQSLNDDFIRTFTVSNTPQDTELQITVKKHGPATRFLWRHKAGTSLKLSVLGFGGQESFRIPIQGASKKSPHSIFIAAGVGITPLLAQAPALLSAESDVDVLWSLRGEDLNLAVDSFKRIDGLAAITKLFITGDYFDSKLAHEVQSLGSDIAFWRMGEDDLKALKGEQRKFFLCTGPTMLQGVKEWLTGEQVVWEDFGY
ncbi:uncharacterized protein TRIVIDRAFT_45249 [Trichoderma virens Gv29-8]|uniref:FAD-binding FR-type domain-containing protein n=1 Tax=Hypocrea virens (strain Gv29-8 / FGSC 10586) TaxID=413071 RepID=G9N5Z5_HYPVG|nr:uncharacterized protein TRIVIDRAFT_45249 [Trichoderma virens Gv29-8]EHK18186.1 hypothetical protein TRIVIDRAFT_45249 [Trichoderma virens Gv29-8]UKZ53943.1 hypothetical protein TrVGV298_007746 [Trichoderma virens]